MVYLLGAWLFLESLSDGESSCAFLCFLFVAVFVFLWLFLIFSNISVNERKFKKYILRNRAEPTFYVPLALRKLHRKRTHKQRQT
jgi:hypothetical protein